MSLRTWRPGWRGPHCTSRRGWWKARLLSNITSHAVDPGWQLHLRTRLRADVLDRTLRFGRHAHRAFPPSPSQEVGQVLWTTLLGTLTLFFVLILDDQISTYTQYYQACWSFLEPGRRSHPALAVDHPDGQTGAQGVGVQYPHCGEQRKGGGDGRRNPGAVAQPGVPFHRFRKGRKGTAPWMAFPVWGQPMAFLS